MQNSKPKATARSTTAKPQLMQAQPAAAQTGKLQDPNPPRQPRKLEVVRSLLERPDGATLDELVSATGWQPHSVRAGMTGLRKQGLTITRAKADGPTRFAIETQPVEVTA
jgi:hypothetical protein